MRGEVDEGQLAAVIEAGLASEFPRERLEAITALGGLPPARARSLAQVALADEPDPALRSLLEEAEGSNAPAWRAASLSPRTRWARGPHHCAQGPVSTPTEAGTRPGAC